MRLKKVVKMKMKKSFIYLVLIIFCFIFPSFLKAKKIFLTGGAGFIGSHVAQRLLERGDSVVLIDNLNDAYDQRLKEYNLEQVSKENLQERLSIYLIDICDNQAMEQICMHEKPDVICHLAARAGVRTSIDEPH